MYQVNYAGLKRRDLYDEIVAIVEGDRTKMKYPNRVATQILNSPYMKQLDAKSLLEIQNQQERLNKEKLKDMIIKSMSSSLGDHHSMVKVLTDKSRLEPAHESLKKDLGDLAAADETFEDARSEVGDNLDVHNKLKELRRYRASKMSVDMLEELRQTGAPFGDRAEAAVNVNSISPKDIASLQSMVYERGVENEQMKPERERMMMRMIDLEQQKRRELADLKALETLKAHDEERTKQIRLLTDEN